MNNPNPVRRHTQGMYDMLEKAHNMQAVSQQKRSNKPAAISDFVSTTLCNNLLKYYLERDENVFLCGLSFQQPIKLGLINNYVPVMRTSLETMIGERDNKNQTRNINIDAFDQKTVELFASIFNGNQHDIEQLKWKDIVSLIEFCHFYQCDVMLKLLVILGSEEINEHSIYEAVPLIDRYEIREWFDACADVLMDEKVRKDVLQSGLWTQLFKSHSGTVTSIMNELKEKQSKPPRISMISSMYQHYQNVLGDPDPS